MKTVPLIALLLCCTLALGADEPKKSDKKPKPVNTVCPVTDEPVDAAQTTHFKGKTVGFCCEGCVEDFNKDPAKFMKKVEAEEAKAKKDAAKKDDQKKGEEKKDEQPVADKNKPVNKFCPIEPEHAVDATVATSTHKGKVVGFCCEDCIKTFERDPDAYVAKLK